VSTAAPSPSLLSALRDRSGTLPATRVDRVWLFAPRQVGTAESSLAVLSLFDEAEPAGRRQIVTLHCAATTERGRVRRAEALVEQGSVPADRVDRMIQGVLHRLRDEREAPRSERIGGDRARWEAMVGEPGPAA
jgi:hypothetical protein